MKPGQYEDLILIAASYGSSHPFFLQQWIKALQPEYPALAGWDGIKFHPPNQNQENTPLRQ